jgi:hypothetical protein
LSHRHNGEWRNGLNAAQNKYQRVPTSYLFIHSIIYLMKKVYVKAALVGAMATVMVTGCGSSKQMAQTPAPTPAPVAVTDNRAMPQNIGVPAEVEVTFPCSGIDSDVEFLRVNANGKSKDRTMAKDRAYQAALANLATKLGGVASMDNSGVGVSKNADGEEFHDKIVTISKVVAKNVNVAGYRTSCEKYTVSPQDGAYNCYITLEYGNKKVVKEMYEQLNANKLLRADYDFDEYMSAFNADLKEYEKKQTR